ncbi:hypothetical protein LWH48_17725 [Halomonas sp. G15]|uniref:CopG family transcriptional regulator n=1 Tax=Halomonas alimentaria TaxID=147248 RepID=A0A7X4W6Z7_9GAMM|nr:MULTISPECIES: DUF411 domain-containing protein [Halomonas]MCE0734599.1 hypothetical protein [Halomonas sp. G15]NAW35548.1 hypothetical protein [Halomonas alimentaria]
MNRFAPTLVVSAALLIGAGTAQAAMPDAATLYKNPQCGCCDEYARQLEALGVEVTVVDDVPIGQVKERAGLPYGLGSCHTIEMGEYIIEGHVPFEAVEKLFEEHPDTDGIGLAGMPIGTPGMPGPKQGDWSVYQFRAGEAQPYMTL